MSRIQNILDKAEREGTVRRIRPVAEPAVSAGVATVDPASAFVMPPPDVTEAVTDAAPALAPVRVISGIRLSHRLIAAISPAGVAAEQYRALRTRILHNESDAAVNVVLVTSPGRSDGKSLTVANLGLTMAQEYQQRICVVDANFRSPQQHRLFGLPEGPGLSDVLVGRASLEEALLAIEEHHITVLPVGTASAHPAELLGTTTMRRTLDTLRSQFDRIIIDSPSVTPLADVGILTPLVDCVILVVRAGVTSKPAIHDAIAAIEGGKLLGVVLNEAAQ
jgi:capsular exopolysaccharide synthesis family protein